MAPPPPRPQRRGVDTHRIGARFEDVAAEHLRRRGWRILARNYRAGRKEIDLVAVRDGVVAFVEVKGRRGSGYGDPLEAIGWRKRREIARVARAWIGEVRRGRRPPARAFRFDAVAVEAPPGGPVTVRHVEDAWRLGE